MQGLWTVPGRVCLCISQIRTDTFYDPYFTPSYQPPFTSPDLETRAREICGDDRFCLFDIAATGNIDVGVATLETTAIIEQIYTFLLPGRYVMVRF